MFLSDICIKRPVFAIVLNLALIMFGLMGYNNVETRFFPNLNPHVVFINASFGGASAKLVESSITDPIENALSTVPGIKRMTSKSSRGASSIKMELQPTADLNQTLAEIRNDLSSAGKQLPDSIEPPTMQVGWNESSFISLGFTDLTKSPLAIRDYIQHYVVNTLLEVPGMGNTLIDGADPYAMRIKLNPAKMAARGISVDDVQNAITSSNLEMPAGMIKSHSIDYPVNADTRLKKPNQFEMLAIKSDNGHIVRLKDIAKVELGSQSSNKQLLLINGQPGVRLNLYTQSDASSIAVAKALKDVMVQIKKTLPAGMKVKTIFDISHYLKASIDEVYVALSLAIFCVVLAVFLFLGSIRSTLIPIATIPVCIISAFGIIYVLGYTVNMITLLALVLAVGLVVDDAIVMLENIHRHIENGLAPMEAAFKGSKQIAFAVIGMTISLATVYAPAGFMHGVIASIFQQFAFTLAGTVIISGFVALTLSPMMCSLLLVERKKLSRYDIWLDRFFEKLRNGYQRILTQAIRFRGIAVIILLLIAASGVFLFKGMPNTFMPPEDMDLIMAIVNTPSGANFNYIKHQESVMSHIITSNPNVKHTSALMDDAPDSFNSIFTVLKPANERKLSAQELANQFTAEFQQIPGLNAFVFAPSPFSRGAHQDLRFTLMTNGSYKSLIQLADKIKKVLGQYKGVNNVNTSVNFDNQQYNITVNRNIADSLGVTVQSIDNTLATFLGGAPVTHFSMNNDSYDVILQAKDSSLHSINNIRQFYVKNSAGKLVPLANLITIKPTLGEATLSHYNHLRSTDIQAQISPGYSMGQVVEHINATLPKVLPSNATYTFRGIAEKIQENSSSMAIVFFMAIIFIYLVLAALFESFVDPFIVLLAVPLCIVGAILALKIFHGSLNIYTDIGLITLIGLIAKHGILITQFINDMRKEGVPVAEAITKGASVRLRPVLMTTTAMIVGALPLVLASGSNAASRFQIGIVIISGLLFGTFFSLFVVPIAYSYLVKFKRPLEIQKEKPNE